MLVSDEWERSKVAALDCGTGCRSSKSGPQPYYMTHSYPPGQSQGAAGSATLPRGGSMVRAYSAAVTTVLPADRIKTIPPSGPPPSRRFPPGHAGPIGRFHSQERLHSESGYMSSPERGGGRGYPSYVPSTGSSYEDPYYSQGYGSRTGSITPVIDEEARLRVEHMERQLANLTGLVQKALTQTPVVTPREYLSVPASRDAYRTPDETYIRSDVKPPKLGKDKSVSFEKSVSFSDEPPDMNSPKQHSPQHSADTKPAKPAIKSSTLPRTSSQEY
ncbi:UNVERIFIED_CONTAM: hypothetical protein PYX00_004670 [Menopon gallinae]|uniref:Uncharacterized protein n=1 Tax=Menopon gallinae TaxID=328185 RepID=A0AAW2I5J0_9NEOP